MIPAHVRWWLQSVQAYDRWRLRRLAEQHPGFRIHPTASTNFANAEITMGEGAQLEIGARTVTERRRGGLRIAIGRDARLEIGEDCWLRHDLGLVCLYVFDGATLTIGPENTMSACHLSAKQRVTLGRRVGVGPGSRVLDSDQHEREAGRPEQMAPVTIEPYCWITADVTILRGVTIGAHSVVGTRSVVSTSLPPHSLAVGSPAKVVGQVGDRAPLRL